MAGCLAVHADPNLKSRSWDILRTVGRLVREDWIVGGDFNAIIDEAEKEGACRKPRVTMDEFRDVMEDLTLVDIKTDKGWFKWVNNRESKNMYRKMKNYIRRLVARIDKLIDGPYEEFNADRLKTTRLKLGHLYAEEESYWAQRSQIKWLKEGDRNTHGNKDITYLNDTIIVLILKIKDPINMTNFHHISLCRVIYKIISKVLVNHLKAALPICISQNQSAFILGRMIHDNILITHELMHYLQSSKNGPNKGFVIKLDMSKAYDHVEWNFLEKVMKNLGFEDAWVDKIICSVRLVKYVVKCNTILLEVIDPEWGLRKGDPLSSYLFLFCMEAFSRMLLNAQNASLIRGTRASQNDPRSIVGLRGSSSTVRRCNQKSVGCSGHAKKKEVVGKCLHGTKFASSRAWESLALETYVFLNLLSLEDKFGSYSPSKTCCVIMCSARSVSLIATSFTPKKLTNHLTHRQASLLLLTLSKMASIGKLVMGTILIFSKKIGALKNFKSDSPSVVQMQKPLYMPLKIALLLGPLLPSVDLMKPLSKTVKLNLDATVSKIKTGFRVIVRDFDGFVLGGGWGFKDEDMTVDWPKLYALEESLKITRSLNIPNAIFETDCVSLANRVKKCREDITIIGYSIKEILKAMEMFNNVAVN
ncbi:reverse transcriptase [Gossypium australe]|uniref:Reverse transcriptase n=1 Tax=Gossypium australe TaxID=47621 RepID=A0A5B6VNM6_9ROSI|nr:reverse transcriptase [Gossypium australe]